MKSVSKIILVGIIAMDPEVRQTRKNVTLTTFIVGSHCYFTSNGEKTVIDSYSVGASGSLAEFCGKYLEKGNLVYIEGLISYDEDDRRHATTIWAEKVKILSFKGDREQQQIAIHQADNESDPSPTKDAN